MKTIMKRLVRDEKGAALVLAIILLLIGGLISAALLGHMGTGILTGEVYETRTAELYAADAGVEDAIWKIQTNNLAFDPATNWSQPWHITANGKNVTVVAYRYDWDWTCAENFTYQILSTAATDDGDGTADIGSSTAIDAHLVVSYLDLANLLDNAIISDNSIIIHNGVNVTGNVTSGGNVTILGGSDEDVDGAVKRGAELDWPSWEDLKAYYWDDVKDLQPSFPYTDPLKIAGADITLQALYRDGPWTIYNDENTPGSVTLSGTVYVKGNLAIGAEKTGKNFTLNLNGQTIFVESADPKYAINIADSCTVIGSGCIIAVGGMYFGPKGDAGSEDDFILVMSVAGNTEVHPGGTFYGCIAGNISVDVKQGTNPAITHTAPEGKGLNIPWGAGDYDKLPPVIGLRIESWEIE
jgi:Flp pilus assembly pilin Flp